MSHIITERFKEHLAERLEEEGVDLLAFYQLHNWDKLSDLTRMDLMVDYLNAIENAEEDEQPE